MSNIIKAELYDVISGKSEVRFGAAIQTISGYLSKSEAAGSEVEDTKHFKAQETKRLERYISPLRRICNLAQRSLTRGSNAAAHHQDLTGFENLSGRPEPRINL